MYNGDTNVHPSACSISYSFLYLNVSISNQSWSPCMILYSFSKLNYSQFTVWSYPKKLLSLVIYLENMLGLVDKYFEIYILFFKKDWKIRNIPIKSYDSNGMEEVWFTCFTIPVEKDQYHYFLLGFYEGKKINNCLNFLKVFAFKNMNNPII